MHDNAELQTAREQLVSYCGRMVADGLAVGAAGNMSVRVGDLVAITPSGVNYAELVPADICITTLSGEEVDAPESPSRHRCTTICQSASKPRSNPRTEPETTLPPRAGTAAGRDASCRKATADWREEESTRRPED